MKEINEGLPIYYPLTHAQKRIYYDEKIFPGTGWANNSWLVRYKKLLDFNLISTAIKRAVRENDGLRLRIVEIDFEHEPQQYISSYKDISIDYVDFSGANIESDFKTWLDRMKRKPFNLIDSDLFYFAYVKFNENESGYLLKIHHIVADGWTCFLLFKEIHEIYEALETAKPIVNKPNSSYIQYVADEHEYINSQQLRKDKEFWHNTFLPLPEPVNLSFKTGNANNIEAKSLKLNFPNELRSMMHDYCKINKTSLFKIVLSALSLCIYRITGLYDILIGSVSHGRSNDTYKNIAGMFVNTLSYRIKIDDDVPFDDFLEQTGNDVNYILKNHQQYPFDRLVTELREISGKDAGYLRNISLIGHSDVKSEKFDYEYIFPGYEPGALLIHLNISNKDKVGILELEWIYQVEQFSEFEIRGFHQGLVNILNEGLANPGKKVSEINLLSPEARKQILHDFNDIGVEYRLDKTIHTLFENQVEKTSGNVAIKNRDNELTYLEVNEKSNQLACVLREKGVKPDCIIGIMLERSMEMIIGIMGILKAGGSYLSLDPNYPKDRLSYLLKDSSTQLLLTLGKFFDFAKTIDFGGETLNLEEESLYLDEKQNPGLVNGPGDLAYIIYTSGSTGRPKGVMIEHGSAVNLLKTLDRMYPLGNSDAYLLKTAFLFDVSVSEIFGWFWRGGRLVILEPGGEREPLKIIDKIAKERITHINFVPSLFNIFVNMLGHENIGKLSGLRYIFLAGEAIWPDSIRKFRKLNSKVIIENLYGPTEATVYASWYPVTQWKGDGCIPIGKPVDNLKIYILGSNDNIKLALQPAGIAGELTITGIGLARGYLNHPQLTAEKFVDNPFALAEQGDKTFKKLYRTGDLARWYDDGNIEYMGRIDHQVKVRGFRIELGEIESQLLKIENIKEAVALAKENKKGEKYLCAYFVASAAVDVSLTRKTLLKSMPDYMVPSHFMQIEKIPLTPNGKLDRKALPDPEVKGTAHYAAPTNEIEEILAGTWSSVLGIEKIGIDDNFFEIGGDSIKAIQIASKLQKHKLKMEVNQVFLHRTIKQLAKYLKSLDEDKTGLTEQGVVEGKVELTPIQKWLFAEHFLHCYHFNQSVTLYRKAGFNETYIEKVFTRIVEHHDALRMKFKFEDDLNTVVQENQGIKGKFFALEVIPIDKENNVPHVIKRESFRIHSSIDLQQGPLVKLALFKGIVGDYLLIVIHHLVVDGISWRILLEDFETGYQQAARGNDISFPEKTNSFKHWTQKLSEYSENKKVLKELTYWEKVEQTGERNIPVDHRIKREERRFKYHDIVSFTLDEEITEKLLTKVNRAYNTEVNDILLAALGLAVKQWTNMDKIGINLEGHGREMIIKDMNITRTVGWFTSKYPVTLDMERSNDLAFYISNVKETLRRIPNKGIGYGILKYLTSSEKKGDFLFKHTPEILFNYLGKFGVEAFGMIDKISGITDLSYEDWWNPEMEIESKIDIEGVIDADRLKLSFIYNKLEYERETIEKFSDMFNIGLEKIIEHCWEREVTVSTPSDLGYQFLSIDDLAKIKNYVKMYISEDTEIQSIYPLNPMQKGLYYHWLNDDAGDAYIEQIVLTLTGDIEKALMEDSLNVLTGRHDVMRTIIIYEGFDELLQIVLKERKSKLDYEDISHLDADKQAQYIENSRMKDLERGFDLTRDQLIRFFLFKTGRDKYRLIWSFHHIIMDGWCIPIIREELKKIYGELKKGELLELEPVIPYVEYINWLEKQGKEEGLLFWEKYLESYEEPARVPNLDRRPKEEDYQHDEYHLTFEKEFMRKLEKMSGKNQVTINTVVQTVWGIILQRYNNRDDVVYGAIVSGRPSEIEGVERMVGLFINMIPLRIKNTGEEEFSQLLKNVQDSSIKSRKYEYLSAAEIMARSSLKGDLIDHLLIFENYPVPDTSSQQEKVYIEEGIEIYEHTHYHFNLIVIPGDWLQVNFSYNKLVYDRALVENISGHFENILRQVVEKPDMVIREIEIITKKERKEILYDFNDTAVEYPGNKAIHQLFEVQVEKTPANCALKSRGEELTYKQLNEKANQLARILKEKGVKPNHIFGLMVHPSVEMMTGILAILKAGGAYLPIDPAHLKDRIDQQLEECEARLLLHTGMPFKTNDFNIEIMNLQDTSLYRGETKNLEVVNSPHDPAYIIHASLSVGNPTVIMMEHASIINTSMAFQRKYPVEPTDVCLLNTTSHCNVPMPELLAWCLAGGSLYIPGKDENNDMGMILNRIESQRITHIYFAPTSFNQMVNLLLRAPGNITRISTLKYVFLSGEAIVPESINRFFRLKPGPEVVNLYRPGDIPVYAAAYSLSQWGGAGRIPVGTPMDNVKVYILNFYDGEGKDARAEPVPVGVPGELCISGLCLPERDSTRLGLTGENFLDNPFAEEGGLSHWYKKLYRTSDLARWLPDGNIEYLGPLGQQVKIRDTRIEIETIEDRLLKQEKVKEAVVVARTDNKGKIYLCAYIVSDKKFDTSMLRETLAEQLPAIMIPSYIVPMERIPITPGGKADRDELVGPQHDPRLVGEKLADIEAEALHISKEQIDLDFRFLELVGHPYTSVQVISMLQKAFNVRISMAELFRRPTLRQLSEFLTGNIKEKYELIQPMETREYYPQSSAQKRLYFLQQMGKDSTVYNIQMMDIYRRGIEKENLEKAFKKLLYRHESLRTSFHVPDGVALQKINDYREVAANFEIKYYETTGEGLIYSSEAENRGCIMGEHLNEVIKDIVKPFDLSRAPLFRVGFVKAGGNSEILILDIHLIISDFLSLKILGKELWELYDGKELPSLRFGYKDFSQWLNSEGRKEARKEQEAFWLEEFPGEIPIINLPVDYPRPAVMSFEGDTLEFEIGEEETGQLKKIAEDHGGPLYHDETLYHGETLYVVLLSLYNVLLAKLSGQEDIVVGIITAGRVHENLQDIVGMFANTLALRNYPEGKKIFDDFLVEVRVNTFAALENQDYPFEQLVSRVAPRQEMNRNPLFDAAFELEHENDPTGYLLEAIKTVESEPYDFGNRNSKFDMTLVCTEVQDRLECAIEYSSKLFKKETIERFVKYFKKIVSSVCRNIPQQIGEIDIISQEEKIQILYEFNDTVVEYPGNKTINQLFEAQAKKTPDNISLVYCDKLLSYRELDDKANQLARVLKKKGVKTDNIICIMVKRSLEMMVALLAALKSGGAYLPIDTEYPLERIKFYLQDCDAKILLTQKEIIDKVEEIESDVGIIDLIDLFEEGVYHEPKLPLENIVSQDDLAYVIFTSGSTGKPKGVMIRHRNAVNFFKGMLDKVDFYPDTVILALTTVSFDIFLLETLLPFTVGLKVVVASEIQQKDPDLLKSTIIRNNINLLQFTPSRLKLILISGGDINCLKAVRSVLLGGEPLPNDLFQILRKDFQGKIFDVYGPTETTVWSTLKDLTKEEKINIGTPIANTHVYIVNKFMILQPVGVVGELYIGGYGVARGYLNRPGLTADRFVENPFGTKYFIEQPHKKIYKTGDLTRWQEDGNIEFLGRIDHQVKIRGFRIELGEIESQLLKIENIKETVVLAKEDKKGEKYLCAYFVASATADISLTRKILSKSMPDYMVPSYFVQIDKIPLTPNGKLDRKALPEPEVKGTAQYVAPTNETEEILTGIWSSVLGNEKIGIDDNFFEIGGDSIKAIQIASKLHKHKLKMEVNQVFLHKTISQLAKYLKPLDEDKTGQPEHEVVEGKVELTPIQKWLFTGHFPHCHHFNQSVTLYRNAGFNETYIEKVFTRILGHHDALRIIFKFEDDPHTVVQENQGIKGKFFDLEVIPIDNEKNETLVIKRESSRIHRSINLKTGPLVNLALFKGAAGDYLLVVIHHLVVDVVCWRILLEDFETGYQQAARGKEIIFQEKTASYKLWSQKLKEYAQSKTLLKELPYWQEVEKVEVKHLPVDHVINKEERKFKFHDILQRILPEEKTRQLLTKVNRAYHTEINDILLSALGLAIKQWTGMDKARINLEGHGREMIFENMDITRTIGWFTTRYPVILDTEKADDLSFYIRSVKETLRAIPNKGIGYGILKYLTPRHQRESLGFKPTPEILFNYLGKVGGESFEVIDRVTGITDLSIEAYGHPDMEIEAKIDIEGVIDGEKLKLLVIYNKKEYKRETIEKFADILASNLETVIDHCRLKEETIYTPSDFGYKNLSLGDLDRISDYIKRKISPGMEIQSIYPLSPMQSGLYFHWLKDEGVNAYLDQMELLLEGEIDKSLLEESLNFLIDRYDVFRTIISYEGLAEPVQVVLKKRKARLLDEDISHLNKDKQIKYIKELRRRDRDRGFDLTRDQLVRFFLVKTGKNQYRLIWTFHHIILDGWCHPILREELSKTYRTLKKGEPLELAPVAPYIEYIKWLENRDTEEGLCYWEKYLEDYEEPAGLPKLGRNITAEGYKHEECHITIEGELMRGLGKMAGKNQVTLNTIVQTLWGVLLQKYNNRDDVVYGTIVSGRPAELVGVERMVGLFINMIPLRIKTRGEKEFSQLLKEVQENSLASRKYEYLAAAEIQARSTLKGDLIDHLLVFENYPVPEAGVEQYPGYIEKGVDSYGQTHYNFNIIVIPLDRLYVNFIYNELVFDRALIANTARHFENVLEQVVKNPGMAVKEIEVITGKEKSKILYDFNTTEVDYPKEKTIHELFELQAGKTPGNVAVISRDKYLTYQELNERSNQLARLFREKGVGPDGIVPIMVERSLEMMIGIFGILKAGGAYLPIDPGFPGKRVGYLLKDSTAKMMLTLGKFRNIIDFDGEIINLEEESLYDAQRENGNLDAINTPKDMAYIIYTSGSTGLPKGVMIEHFSVINRLTWMQKFYPIGSRDVILQKTTFVFDVSVWELFWWSFVGACQYLLIPGGEKDPAAIVEAVEKNNISTMHFVPSMLNIFLADIEGKGVLNKNTCLKQVFTSGEALTLHQMEKFNQLVNSRTDSVLINLYGPTEATVDVSYFNCPIHKKLVRIPIGKPIDNTKLFVVDFKFCLQPIGVPGELCITGDQLARGYLNRPLLTDEKFVTNPLAKGENWGPMYDKLYRTGDLARWLLDGNIEYLGRIDHQVKIRGFRIETGEIENKILTQQDQEIKEAVVIAREDNASEKYLCAYIVSDKKIDTSSLSSALSKDLPEYMIPSYFVQVDKIPLSTSGKVDRKRLPVPQIKARGESYAAPRNEIEDKLAGIWSQLLHIKKDLIGIDDDFFKLGGHSLKAAVMITMIHKHFNVKVKMHEIFNMPTIRKLAGFISEAKEHVYFSIPLAEEKEYYPQTSPQKRLFFMAQLENAGIVYNMQLMDVYCKGIEKEALEEAVRKLIKRHESLRTSFFTLEGEAVQKIHPFKEVDTDFAIEYYEMSDDEIISPGQQGKGIVRGKDIHFKDLKELTEHFVRPFDLTRPPLLRLGLIKIWGNTKILMLDTHHIVSDGISLVVFLNDLWELYDGEELPGLNIQYKDFARWTRHDKQKAAVKKQEKYWLSEFAGEIAVLNLPYDQPRPSRLTFNGNMLHFEVEKEYTQKLNEMAREQGVTLYMLLFAAYNVLLAKLSGQEAIVVGTVTAGRDHADLQKLIGMFVNTLALRSFPKGNKTFKEFLGEVKEITLAAFENQDYPFEELAGKVSTRGDVSRNPVFDVLFGLDNEAERTDLYLLEALMVDKSNPFRTRKAKFDISLVGAETGEEMHFNLEYNTNLFKEETIERFIKNFKTILASITGDICKQLLEIDIIPHDERAMILYMFNDTEAEYPKDKMVHELFEKQVAKKSGNVAVVGHDLETGGEIALDYKELNKRANQLGRLLRDKGFKPDHIAAIMLEPSAQMIIGMLAILKAGGGLLPVDHKIPGERVKYMLEDSNVRLFLSQLPLVKDIDYDGEIIPMDAAGVHRGTPGNLESVNNPGDLAYVIYTSGSTGKPKGVLVEHRSLVNLCFWHNNAFSVTSADRATKYAGFGFDASIWEVFPYLVIGAGVYIVPEEIKLDIKALNRYFEDNGITASFLPTQICEQFFTVNNKTLRLLLTGGDKLKSFVKRRYQFYNNYGPTENTVVATSFLVTAFSRNIPIGGPIANNQVYILDRNRNLLPIGVPGELCVGGDSIARGYMNNPRLTYQKFIENPYPPPLPLMQSPRLYCTGDLARWLDDGNIEFLGRIDYQVKVRGYRIELGEIENQLMHLEDVNDVVVIAREDNSGQKYLCAYLVADKTADILSIKKKLAKNLPDYMIPAYFMQLEQIPLNPNGKIDRGRLPEPQISEAAEYAPPRSETEKILAEVWSEVLEIGIEKVSIDDNFFEIGGDSIKSILMSGRLQKRQLSINVNNFFSNPTIRKAAVHVQKIQRKIDQNAVEGVVELTPIQKWFFEKDFKEKHHFNHFVWLYSSKRLDNKMVKQVFTRILEHHDALRMVYDISGHPVVQENRGIKQGKLFDLKVIDLRDKKDTDFDDYIERINRGIHLKTGPLVKLALFKTTTGDHLLVAIHHLVVDGVSWRVLVEDFETGYEQAERGENIKFPHKTDSFRYWAYQLKQYAHSPQLLKELDYWKKIEETNIEGLPKDRQVDKNKKTFNNREVVILHLDRKETEKLLEEVNFTYNTETYEILLAALGMAVNEWSDREKILINVGRHSRETVIEDIDISRTVGWFSSQYPLLLDMKYLPGKAASQEEQLAYQIRQVKETVRRVPNKGIGYGILKYLTSPGERKNITFKLQPEIRFNYFGKLARGKDELHKRFQVNFGYSYSPEYNMEYDIDIMGVVESEGLKLSIVYNKYEYEKSTLKKLADYWKSSLIKIIDHCTARKKEILSLDMSALDYQIKKDYEKYLERVREEKCPDLTAANDYRHILLTGVTGYMGAYLVPGLLEKTEARLYLPVRGATQEESDQRFQKKMAFYFGGDFYNANKDRLVVLRSDLSENQLGMDPSSYEKLCKTVDAVVHSAANVKHYGVYADFFRDNVEVTENVLEFASSGKNKDFHFISTLNTGSGDIPGKEFVVFTEYCHDQGQATNHLYIKSKLEAEKRVLAYRDKGLNASIYRAGNLTFHSQTGEFQENIENNAFYAIMKGVIKVGFLSDNMKKSEFDMSFIDYAARAVVLLLTRKGLINETFHISNPHLLTMKKMIEFLQAVGIEIPDVETGMLEEHLAQFTGNAEYEKIIQRVKLDSWAWDERPVTLTITKNDRTIMLLNKLGFQWPEVTKKHIEKMIAYCRKVGFL